MKSRRLIALVLGTCVVFTLSPMIGLGQDSTTTPTQTTAPVPITNVAATSRPTSGMDTATSTTPPTAELKSSTIGAGSATSMPSSSNNLAPWYGDPYSMGLPSKYVNGPPSLNSTVRPTVTFNKGNYVETTTSGGTTTPKTNTTTKNGFTTVGTLRNPRYTTVLSDDIPIVAHKASDLQANVRDVILRSTKLKNRDGIQVAVNDGAVILTGQVASNRERELVEAMIGMTPGVRGVQNDLTVVTSK